MWGSHESLKENKKASHWAPMYDPSQGIVEGKVKEKEKGRWSRGEAGMENLC